MYLTTNAFVMVIQISSALTNIRNYQLSNVTWFTTKIHEFPTLYFEMDFEITFPSIICCPMVALSMYRGHFHDCFPEGVVPDSWYKNALFYLEPKTSGYTNVRCNKNSTLDIVSCKTVRVEDQDYVPKQHYMYFGYSCSDVHNFSEVNLKITMYKESNVTLCQKVMTFDQPGTILDPSGNVLSCSQFYPYTSLPNAYGDSSQAEAEKSMVIFNNYFTNNREAHCHKHLMRLVCMTFLPMCPFTYLNESAMEVSDSMLETSYLIPPCKEAAIEVIQACSEDIKLFPDFSTSYYPGQTEVANCYYEPVQCGRPPHIKNGTAIYNRTIFYAKDTVHYICEKNFEFASDNNYSMCRFSGFWTPEPVCKKPSENSTILTNALLENKITSEVIIIVCCTVILLVIIVIIVICKKLLCNKIVIPNNADLVSRNRPYDAFLSYESGDRDEQFVRNEICPKLDSEYGGKFKLLIHQRDFPAGTLILANIQNAVKDSNCAIILRSQTYINSRWCQQEFEECVEESKKDENYRVIVILMKSIEVLKTERMTPYMEAFARSKTYLELTDPKLWAKIEQLLEKHKTPETIQLYADTKV